jgi:hypothetical protein
MQTEKQKMREEKSRVKIEQLQKEESIRRKLLEDK